LHERTYFVTCTRITDPYPDEHSSRLRNPIDLAIVGSGERKAMIKLTM
jgi:hypothetical protein